MSKSLQILLEAEEVIKDILSEKKKKKKKTSFRKAFSVPLNLPLASVFSMDNVQNIDGTNEIDGEMFNYGKVINELLEKTYGHRYELFDLEEAEGYEVDEDTEVLVDEWVNNEFQMNVIKFMNQDKRNFPKGEYDRISNENERLANIIYDTYGTFDWIKDAEKKLKKLEKEFEKEHPNYVEWTQHHNGSANFHITEDDEVKKPKANLRKYKISVRDKNNGKISRVKFGGLNKRANPKDEKLHPRHWAAKWWSKNHIGDAITEIVDPKSIDINYLSIRPTLNPKIWADTLKLYPEVRTMLLKNALEFLKFLEMDGLPIVDVVFTGSQANYSWTEFSDLDVHIVVDFSKLTNDSKFMGEFFRTKKSLWEEKVKPTIKGYDVEVYIEDSNEDVNTTGTYSLIEDKWRRQPLKQIIGIDSSNIQLKAAAFMNAIERVEEMDDENQKYITADAIREKLRKYRQSGLASEGEFSTENLVFKILRNTGFLEKITKIKKDALQKELTLENKIVK